MKNKNYADQQRKRYVNTKRKQSREKIEKSKKSKGKQERLFE